MKKTFLTLALASTFGIVAAQDLKPVAGTMGFTAGFKGGLLGGVTPGTSPTGSLHFKYYVTEGLAARVGFNLTIPNSNGTSVTDSVPLNQSNQPIVQRQTTTITSGGVRTQVSLGIQKSLGGTDKLDVYTGADVFFGGATASVKDSKTEVIAAPAGVSEKVGDYTQQISTTPGTWKGTGIGGFNMGVNGFVGFQYFIVEKLSLGAEFAYGYIYNSGDNGTNGVNQTTTVAGGTTTTSTRNFGTNMHTGTHGLGVAGSTITLSFYW